MTLTYLKVKSSVNPCELTPHVIAIGYKHIQYKYINIKLYRYVIKLYSKCKYINRYTSLNNCQTNLHALKQLAEYQTIHQGFKTASCISNLNLIRNRFCIRIEF